LQHEGRRHYPAIDDVALEAYQQRELDRVAQTIVTSIAAVERIDSAGLLELDA
jgi:ABC-type transporter Mla MlaB component